MRQLKQACLANLLITGGAGFIGSHTCLVLLEAGHQLVVLDSFANSSPESLRRVRELAGPAAGERLLLVEGGHPLRSRPGTGPYIHQHCRNSQR